MKLQKTIKTLILFSSVVGVAAMAEHYPNYKIKLDWNSPKTLSDNVVQTCDDTYYPAVEIKIPGKGGKDFSLAQESDVNDEHDNDGCTIERTVGRGFEIYKVNATSSCTIHVLKTRSDDQEEQKTAVYEISDAC